MTYVKNCNREPEEGSMIEKWEEYTGENCPVYCSNIDCNKKLTKNTKCGAHVYKCDKDGKLKSKNIYIVPLCKECNHYTNKNPMKIDDDNLLAPLNELNQL